MRRSYRSLVSVCLAIGCVIFIGSVGYGGIDLKDDFESGMLFSIWTIQHLSENALRHVSAPVRTGQRAIEITVYPGAVSGVGADGQVTERAELREAAAVRLRMGTEAWYAIFF
ncbi:MAG: hypothetical protein P1P89_20570 [Desulfobacterales bacterium]|nr:hypothetical protein [Desulfobacterales bacterium]